MNETQRRYARVRTLQLSDSYSTPEALRAGLDEEFGPFTLDPCPLDPTPLPLFDGLDGSWRGHRVFCNPPYSNIAPWLVKGLEAIAAVYLLPSRTDSAWFHEWAPRAHAVRFLRGRLRFGGAVSGAPFPSVVLVYLNNNKGGDDARD